MQCSVHATVSNTFLFLPHSLAGATAIATDTAFRQYINDIAGAADPNCLAPDFSHPRQFVFGIWNHYPIVYLDHYPIVYLDHYPSVYDAIGRVQNLLNCSGSLNVTLTCARMVRKDEVQLIVSLLA